MSIFYALLKQYVNFGLHLFFKKLIVKGRENIPKNGPVIFLANHQNALLDALLIVTNNQRKTHFVARADVFKKPLVKRLLKSLYMMPIYRIRDGREALKLNDHIFEECILRLSKGDCLVIFPEGNHSMERRLRPLSKGFTRIAFGALEKLPALDLKIILVGLNYTSHQEYRGSVSLYFGEPIAVKDHVLSDDRTSIDSLKMLVSERLKTLTTHIDDHENYAIIAAKLDMANPDYLDPVKTNEQIKSIESLENKTVYNQSNSFLRRMVYFPVFVNSIIPFLIWKSIEQSIEDPVMVGTIKFCVGISIFPICYLIQAGLVAFVSNVWIAGPYLLLSIFSLPLLKIR